MPYRLEKQTKFGYQYCYSAKTKELIARYPFKIDTAYRRITETKLGDVAVTNNLKTIKKASR